MDLVSIWNFRIDHISHHHFMFCIEQKLGWFVVKGKIQSYFPLQCLAMKTLAKYCRQGEVDILRIYIRSMVWLDLLKFWISLYDFSFLQMLSFKVYNKHCHIIKIDVHLKKLAQPVSGFLNLCFKQTWTRNLQWSSFVSYIIFQKILMEWNTYILIVWSWQLLQ